MLHTVYQNQTKPNQKRTNKQTKPKQIKFQSLVSRNQQYNQCNNGEKSVWICRKELGHGSLHKGNMKTVTLPMPFSQRPPGTCL